MITCTGCCTFLGTSEIDEDVVEKKKCPVCGMSLCKHGAVYDGILDKTFSVGIPIENDMGFHGHRLSI
ncbi:MAG: hypothetical protein V1851_02410 [Patescibacteria group bacterium]